MRLALSAAVLAGGASRRMGRDKAFVAFGERPLIEHVVERLQECSDDVFVVAKGSRELVAVRSVDDDDERQTPLAGIAAALRAARHPLVFVCACDMPFVSASFIRLLADRAGGYDAVVPLRDDRPEPLHAVWSTSAEEGVRAALASGELAVHRVLETLSVAWVDEREWRRVDPEGRSLININTPTDLERAERPISPSVRGPTLQPGRRLE